MILALLIAMAGIPVLERPATAGTSDTFAVLITGDGGWRKVDKGVGERLRAAGIPVVGFLASDYFRTERTPDESAKALESVIRTYQTKWQKRNVVLIGYSRGADVMPFMVSRLPDDLRQSTKLVALLGSGPSIDFKLSPWWSLAHYFVHPRQYAVLPEVEKLTGFRVMCVYGEKETDSICPALDPTRFTIVRAPGGHHFAGRYDEIGRTILTELAR